MSETNNKRVILVVEDEKPLQRAISLKLNKNDFEVVIAATADQAIEQLKKTKKISAIWLDHYLLGNTNGLDFVSIIKKNKEWQNIPIFVVTNTTSQDKMSEYVDSGINKFYTKANFRLDEIIKDINEAFNK
jgi:CheY-like chemotaxis protein